MKLPELIDQMSSLALAVSAAPDGKLRVVGDNSRLTNDMKEALQKYRSDFVRLLAPRERGEREGSGDLMIGDRRFEFSSWTPEERLRSPIAIDTETELIDGATIPRIALATVSDGKTHRLIKPENLGAFIQAHYQAHFVAHNASFDFAVIRQAIGSDAAWVAVADHGRLHDTMVLDSLIRLGRNDTYPSPRDLGTLAKLYLNVEIDKNDPYRRRYAELIDCPWDQADPGVFTYAIKDAIVTWQLFRKLTAIAAKIGEPFANKIFDNHLRRFGFLTETLQVRAAIALSQIERNGITLDQSRVGAATAKLTSHMESLVDQLSDIPEADGLFKRAKESGELIRSASGKPSSNRSKLQEILTRIGTEAGIAAPGTSKTKKITTSMKFWAPYADRSMFLSLWLELEETTKLRQTVAGLQTQTIHPKYTTLVRTGRTSCSKPNIQQLPRSGGVREMVVPSPGNVFLTIDYSAIELRTLAAVCERRFGQSRLADVIREGVDPHNFTAAMFEGVGAEDFDNLPDRKLLRQRAKALNFGIPGGLGAESLVNYAANTYGVQMTVEAAETFRSKVIRDVYPELEKYLADDLAENLAVNLKTFVFEVRFEFDSDGKLGAAKRIVGGKGKADGTNYGKSFVKQIWTSLRKLNRNQALASKIRKQEAGEQLQRELFFGPVATLTGRIRGSVGFAQARNTPFQGLAADGAKIALWKLYAAGYRCVAFVHDEFLIELPVDADHTSEGKRIDRILCESMQSLTGSIPIACEYSLSDRWYKEAEAVFDDAGKLKLWYPR